MDAGEVLAISVPGGPEGRFHLQFRVLEKFRPILRSDSVATIQMDGLVGSKVLQVGAGSSAGGEIRDGATIQSREPMDIADVIQQAADTIEYAKGAIEEDFWGLGPRSSRDQRTSFRMEDVELSGAFGVRPLRWLRLGLTGGMLNANTGPGQDRDHPSVEERFDSGEAPALDHQPDYWHAGAFLQADYRDSESDPRRGGNFELRWTDYRDRDLRRFSFHRIEAELHHFFPLVKRGTIALRSLTSRTAERAGQQAPFFLHPTAGGGGDVRGFHQYRFRDKNATVVNLEYRWRVHPAADVVAFGDAGQVFSGRRHFRLSGFEGSAGGGGRVKLGGRVFVGLDVGVSREGPRLWFRSGHTF